MQVLHGVQVGGGAVTIPAIAEALFASSRTAVLIISIRRIRWPRWAAGLFSRIAPLIKKKDSKAKMVPTNAKKDFPRNIADFGKAGRKRVEG